MTETQAAASAETATEGEAGGPVRLGKTGSDPAGRPGGSNASGASSGAGGASSGAATGSGPGSGPPVSGPPAAPPVSGGGAPGAPGQAVARGAARPAAPGVPEISGPRAHGGSAAGPAPGSVLSGDGVGPATGRAAVVGRAAVGETTGSAPKFTRAPGMPPPPEVLLPSQGPGDASGTQPISIGVGSHTGAGRATVPVVAGAARGAASVTSRPPIEGPTGVITGSARVTEAVRAARATVSSAAGRGPRRARLHVKRIDPWSTMKFSFAVSLVLFFVAVVATSVLYLALDAMDVFDAVNGALAEMIGNTGGEGGGFRITAKGIVGGSALLGAVNVVLFTALATLGAFIYNVCADLVGGIELTLAEKD